MLLFNMMVMSGDASPLVVSVFYDCTDQGWKKDSITSLNFFRKKAYEFHPDDRIMDVFFFDCASNVQRQATLCVKPFLGYMTFMVTTMSCPSSSVIYQN